ncbi:MAG: hypothetical protein WCI73_02465 [Phycisphaerae bacterium]
MALGTVANQTAGAQAPPIPPAPSDSSALPASAALVGQPDGKAGWFRRRWGGRWGRYDAWLKVLSVLAVLVVLIIAGTQVSAFKIDVAKKVEFIGHSDECAYATMAQSLVAGKGLQVNYVSWHFLPYDSGITRREDHWPPFMGLAIAPFYYYLGQEVWVAKVAPILIGSILLPLLTAALALVYSRRAYVALAAGLIILVEPRIFTESMKTLSDVPTAALVAGFCWALLAARNHRWMHLVVGLFLAAAYYAKGSQIILLGLYPAAMLLLGGLSLLKKDWRWIAAGLGTALLLMAPYMYSNYRLFGNPLHSTQNYVSGYIGLAGSGTNLGWESGTYTLYWGKNLPKPSDRWNKYPKVYHDLLAKNRECFTRWALLGPSTGDNGEEWDDLGVVGWQIRRLLQDTPEQQNRPVAALKPVTQWAEPLHEVPGCAVLVGVPLLLLGTPLAWWWRRRRRRAQAQMPDPQEEAGGREESPWLLQSTLALLVIAFSQWLFLVVFWQWLWMFRLAFVMTPIILVIGLTLISRVLEAPFMAVWAALGAKRWRRGGVVALAVINLLAVGLTIVYGPALRDRRIQEFATGPMHNGFPWCDNEIPGYMPTVRMGRYIKNHLPNAIIMNRYPWQLVYYAAPTNKAVVVPLEDPEKIFAVARYYHCTHIVRDGNRPALEPYFYGQKPGLKRVRGAPDGALYELDWSQLPGLKATAELEESSKSFVIR